MRPTTASGALESHEFLDLLDEWRLFTAPGKNLLGLDPTYVTSRHHVPGVPITSKFRGRQVFGGIPENDLKGTQGRRATLAGLEDVELHEKPKRPTTAVGVTKQVKVGYWLNSYRLNRMRLLKYDRSYYRNNQWQRSELKSKSRVIELAVCCFSKNRARIVSYPNFLQIMYEISVLLFDPLN